MTNSVDPDQTTGRSSFCFTKNVDSFLIYPQKHTFSVLIRKGSVSYSLGYLKHFFQQGIVEFYFISP